MKPTHLLILLGLVLIGLSIVGAQLIPHYQITAGADGNGNPVAWRVNTRTGKVDNCHLALDPNPFNQIVPDNGRPGLATIIECNDALSGSGRK
ncbi:hypothetical protein [Bradyrhizobium sp. SZCCHNS3051]|uniref:hypothetical protein n=1 Tax=Bradyrhizobium sp. SZCCHNS3051 TaxID=3057320 RepID=UPI0029167C64|nr:hypothetical protein [Bradyrhizobium sp. SZCCHNS3051]